MIFLREAFESNFRKPIIIMSEKEKIQPLALIDSSIGSRMWIIMKVSKSSRMDGKEGS